MDLDPTYNNNPNFQISSTQNSNDSNKRTVFISNISYDSTEQQLREVFESVGEILSLRIVTDKETGKHKGFAFCEYADASTAQSAVRNLHNQEFNGRSLRVNLAQYDKGDKAHLNPNDSAINSLNSTFNQSMPQLAIGSQSHSAVAIAALLKSLTKTQLLEVLNETQKFINANPEGSRQLLIDNPQLTLAILHIQIMFGMIKPEDVQAVLQQQSQAPAFSSIPPHSIPPPFQAPPSSLPPPPQIQQPFLPFGAQMPPPPNSQLPPSIPNQPTMAPNDFGITFAKIAHLPQVEQNAIMEIVKLKPEDIQKLPPQEQQTVISLLQKVKR